MPIYAPPEKAHLEKLEAAAGTHLPIFEDLDPAVVIVLSHYEDDNSFDAAQRKKLATGKNPVRIVEVNPLNRYLIQQHGGPPIDFILHIDPAVFDAFPPQAQEALIHNALARIICERDSEGDFKVKGDGRHAYGLRPKWTVEPETLSIYGAFNDASEKILGAATAERQETFDWHPKMPDPIEPTMDPEEGRILTMRQTEGTPEDGAIEQREPAKAAASS